MGTFFDDASLVMIPSGVKESKLYSIKPTDGTGDFTFTRGTDTATRVNSAGLIEKETQNLLTYSNTFSNAAWVKLGAGSGTAASVTSGFNDPDGGSNAWRLQCDLNGGSLTTDQSLIYQGGSLTGVFSFSYYVKSNTGASQDFAFGNSLNGYKLATATTSWQRFTTFHNCTSNNNSFIGARGGLNTDDTLDILIYAAQLEQGLVARDYIETTTAAVYAGITDNLPRLDYSGGATCPSLLLEPQRTNIMPSSEDIDSVWSKLRVSVENNNTTSPEGFVNAGKTTATAVAGTHASYDTLTGSVTAGNDYFISCFVKKATTKYIRLNEGYTGAYVTFNFDDQTTDLQNGASDVLLEEHANGWYRLGFKFTADSSGNSQFALYINDDNNNTSYTGSGEAVYLWGAQVEAGSYPTSYIPCMGVSATRAKDFINQNIQTLTSGLTEGTLFIEFEKPNTGENNDVMRLRGSGNLGRAYIYNNGLGFASDWLTSSTFTLGENTKAAWRLDSLSSGVEFLNGVKGAGGSGTAWSDIRLLRFNADGNGGVLKIKQILFFPTALTDAECITLTTL
jgi:hypothetical protein